MQFNMGGYVIPMTVNTSPTAITGPGGIGADGPIDVILRVDSPGIYLGNAGMDTNLPSSGYELLPDVEYRFTFHGGGAYVATTSVTYVHAQVFVSPHVA